MGPAAAFNSPLHLLLKCSFARWKCCFIAAKILTKDTALGAQPWCQQGNVPQSRGPRGGVSSSQVGLSVLYQGHPALLVLVLETSIPGAQGAGGWMGLGCCGKKLRATWWARWGFPLNAPNLRKVLPMGCTLHELPDKKWSWRRMGNAWPRLLHREGLCWVWHEPALCLRGAQELGTSQGWQWAAGS